MQGWTRPVSSGAFAAYDGSNWSCVRLVLTPGTQRGNGPQPSSAPLAPQPPRTPCQGVASGGSSTIDGSARISVGGPGGNVPMSRGLWFAMNARTRRSLTLLWTALFLFSLALQSVQLATPAPALAAHNEGIFELDGDADDSGAAGADWENGAEGSLDQFFVGGAVEKDGADTTYFTGGGSKD